MPRFHYQAKDAAGSPVSGELDAATRDDAAGQLAARGFKIDDLGPTGVEPNEPSARPLAPRDVALVAQQIAGLTQANLPLSSGLAALADELPGGSLRGVLRDIAQRLDRGEPLDAALESQGRRLPPHFHGLVQAGVRAGRLGEVLTQFASQYEIGVELRRKVRLVLAYPAILFGSFVAIVGFMLVVLVPEFKKIFTGFGIKLPSVTAALIELSDLAVALAHGGILFVLVPLVAAWVACRILLPASLRRRVAYRIPFVGPIARCSSLAEFSHLLGLLVSSDVPLPMALELMAGGSSDANLREAAAALARSVAAGEPLADSAMRFSQFPESFCNSVRWGERSSTLAESLQAAGELYEGEARLQSEFAPRVAPPIVLMLILAIVGLIVLALFLPLMKLITEISA